MNHVAAIALGGAVGSLLRYWMSGVVSVWLGRGFPYGTLTVNIVGCFFMGLLSVISVERLEEGSVLRAGILIGLLGGFTTFSAFSMETFNLIQQGALAKAAANILSSLFVCIAATWVGVVLAKQF